MEAMEVDVRQVQSTRLSYFKLCLLIDMGLSSSLRYLSSLLHFRERQKPSLAALVRGTDHWVVAIIESRQKS